MTEQVPSKEKSTRVPWNTPMTDDDYLQRMKGKSIITESGCWELQGYMHKSKGMKHKNKGYVDFSYRNKRWKGHRLAYLLTRGIIPAGMVVMHKCDNPPCCNPDHLELGTEKENMREAGKRKRWPRQYRDTCINGHPRTPENVVYHGREQKLHCRICSRMRQRRLAGWPEHLLNLGPQRLGTRPVGASWKS